MSPKTKPKKLSFKKAYLSPQKKYWTWAHVMHVTIFFSLLFHNYLNTWHRVGFFFFFFGVNMHGVVIIVKKLNMVCVFLLEKM